MNTDIASIAGLIIAVLVAHFVGDFVVQTHRQAQGKSRSLLWLSLHVFTYFLTLSAWAWAVVLTPPLRCTNVRLLAEFVLVNTALHFATDFFTSKLNAYLWKKGDVHNFFVGVGFDQLLHYLAFVITAVWIFG